MMQTATNPQTGERLQLVNGQWVPAQGNATPGPIFGPPPVVDPLKVSAEQRAQEDQQFQREKFGWEKQKFDREMAQGPKSEASAKTRQDAITGYQAAQSLYRLVGEMRQKYEAGPGATSGPAGVLDYLPTETNKAFDAAGNAARGIVGQALGFTGGQLNSVQEAEMAIGPYLPTASDYDSVALDKISRLEKLANDAEARAIALLGGRPDEMGRLTADAPQTDQMDRSANLAENFIGVSGSETAPTQSGTQTVANPALAGVRGKYLDMLAQGAPASQIIPFLRSAGVNDPKLLQSALKQIDYRRRNPNVPIENYNTDQLDLMDVPLSATESMMNDAAQSALGAYTMRAGNAVTANNLDSIVGMTGGNAERARIGLEDAQQQHPYASLGGDISGGVMAALGAEAGLARLGLNPGMGRALLADTGYGAAAGAGAADNGDRLHGAMMGGLAGLGGSAAGQGIMKVAGSAISPTGGSLSDLYAAGVRPTPGQRLVEANGGKGLAGLAGRIVNSTEEGLSSVPVLGSSIRGARQEARDQFQIGAYNQALGDIGKKLPEGMKPGTAPYRFAKQAFNEAYDKARSGMQVAADEQLANEITDISGKAMSLAEPSIRRFESIIQNKLLRRISGDVMDGKTFKTIVSELNDTIRGIRKNQSGDGELADVLEDVVGAIDGAARRSSPADAVAALDAADAGYAQFVRIRDAAKSRGGAAAEFSPTQFDRSVQRNTGGKYSDAYLRGDALMQDYAQQGMSLVDRIPNSGTPERLGLGATLAGGAAYVEPSSLGLMGILSLLYAPGVRKATTGAMAPREGTKALADQVRKGARISGAASTAVAVRPD